MGTLLCCRPSPGAAVSVVLQDTPMSELDYAVIGGGIAGISVAAELSRSHKVLLLEREPHLAYHTTGRSAAIYSETYGNRTIRALSSASRPFFEHPPEGFTAQSLLTPRAC